MSLYAWAVRDGDVTSFCQGNFDYDKDVDGTDAFVFKKHFGRSQIHTPCPPDGPAPVERTWQSISYAYGDDGWYYNGVHWGGDRFTDNGNGTITDGLTGLIWLKEANCFGQVNWSDALVLANALANGSCGLTDGSIPGSWRLPNVKEMTSLVDYDYVNPAMYAWQFFNNVQSAFYWSSTTRADDTDGAWYVGMYGGSVNYAVKTSMVYVWPVHGGRNW